MKKPPSEVPADDDPRDVSRPALPRRPDDPAAGVRPTPESDARTHQRFTGEGQPLEEREKKRRP